MKKGIIAVALLGTALASSAARAEIEWKDYKFGMTLENTSTLSTYLGGQIAALGAANAALAAAHRPKLYCQPTSVVLNSNNIHSLLMEIRPGTRVAALAKPETPLSTIVLGALQEAFPCK